MNKTFVTIFPICENVHLTKDLGQIPYFLHKTHGFDSKIVSYKNNETYDNLNGEVKGLKMDFVENTGRISFLEKGILKYIYSNAKKIDVLNLYIFSKHTFVYGIFYKMLNPSGFLFLKLDGYNETFAEGNKVIHSTKRLKNFILKRLEEMFLKRVDLISIENSEGEHLVKNKFPEISNRIIYLPVGVNDLFIEEKFGKNLKPYSEKENIILNVGRIGEEIKNHEMIIRALTNVNMKDWKMVFVGPVNPDFMLWFDKFIMDFPELKSKVVFTGNIADRLKLYEWYNRSKIFCMTSLKESFCHSIAEALYFGNYIIGTEGIMSMQDITDNEKFGIVLKSNDDAALAKILNDLINSETKLAELCPQIVQFSRKRFVWSEIIEKVFDKIVTDKRN
jgi:L-malate glycosyltransferase